MKYKFVGIKLLCIVAFYAFIFAGNTFLTDKGMVINQAVAQTASPKYEPTWESLEKHPLPQWFDDAKFGMFIDYGLYSVAGWAPRVDDKTKAMYPDWYVNRMYTQKETIEYHQRVWGKDFQRDDFIPLFTASQYDPENIVKVAVEAGMKYIVLFCKHHDGFCLWQSSYTHRDVGDMGPKRDLVKPLIDACNKAGLKFGFYFSVDEWEYPIIDKDGTKKTRIWTKDPAKELIPYDEKAMKGKISGKIPVRDFINDYIYPQVIEFIDKYDPDILWFDGEWDRPAEYYKTKEMVAHFYNHAEGRKEVAVNDRLGKGERDVHGDFFTSEYGNRASEYYGAKKVEEKSHKWEECRGISQSFGYHREDTDENVQTPEQLIHMLVSIVSRNGNLLLITNLDGNGAMPQVYKTRLKATGDWLSVNSEAIYGSYPWKTFSEGETIWYTRKNNTVYAICLKLPEKELLLNAVKPSGSTVITMLGKEGQVKWKEANGKLVIDVPQMAENQKLSKYAYVFKISGVE